MRKGGVMEYKDLAYENAMIIKMRKMGLEKLSSDNEKLKDMLINDHGECPECVDAKLQGYTICGDCSC